MLSGLSIVLVPIALLWYSAYLLVIFVASIVTIAFASMSSAIASVVIAKGYRLVATDVAKISKIGKLLVGLAGVLGISWRLFF